MDSKIQENEILNKTINRKDKIINELEEKLHILNEELIEKNKNREEMIRKLGKTFSKINDSALKRSPIQKTIKIKDKEIQNLRSVHIIL